MLFPGGGGLKQLGHEDNHTPQNGAKEKGTFFKIPFYLQSVLVQSANCV
jgi:hypothetical protein